MNIPFCLTFIRGTVTAGIALVLMGFTSVRFLRQDEAAGLRGGQNPVPPCAKDVVTTTDSCYLRVTIVGGTKYRCDGKDLDQACTAADNNSGLVCDKNTATCSGNQERFDANLQQWVADGKCAKTLYTTAKTKAGECVPPGQ
jgi:hypothetical protein